VRGKKSDLECVGNVLSLLDSWGELLAKYVIDQQTSGCVEGLNNKLTALKRRCYGMRTAGRLCQRLTHDRKGYRRCNP
jgi:transposase